MHPLLYGYFLPDGAAVSRDAAERHANRPRHTHRARAERILFRAWGLRLIPQP